MTLVLIVEDDSWQAEHMTRQLERAGYQVKVSAHALEAINHIDSQPPDVMILDMFLPGANGITLLHEVRSHVDLANIPVIVCSTEPMDKAKLRPYGVVAVLDKTTMTNNDLIAAVKKVVT